MELISTKTHGYLDYLMAIVFIFIPFTFNLDSESAQGIVFYVFGASMLFFSVLTNYELGFIKSIPMKTHLVLDVVSGIFLAASPWLFKFSDTVYLPHLILGLLEIGTAMMTSSKPRK